MTKKKILRGSSKRLTDQYRFKRELSSGEHTTRAFRQRNERINRICPVKEISILDPVLESCDDVQEMQEASGIHITKNQSDWPYRVEYIEQLLDIEHLWVVIADGRDGRTPGYRYSEGAASTYVPKPGLSLDIVSIFNPKVVIGNFRFINESSNKILRTEKELRQLEKEETGTMTQQVPYSVWIEGENQSQGINLHLCNILPKRLTMYNCSFYNEDVAHLYLDSLSEHLSSFVDSQTPKYR